MTEKIPLILLMLICGTQLAVAAADDTRADEASRSVSDKEWNIVAFKAPPLLYKSRDGYYGFVPDLLEEVSKTAGFSYKLYEPPDGELGHYDNMSGKWMGTVGQVIDGKADMAAAPITVSTYLERYLDFAHPFMNSGLTIVVKKPHTIHWELDLSIVYPLEPQVWAIVFVFGIVVTVLLWLLNRFNPYDYGSRLGRGLCTEQEADSFSLLGSFWFVFTTLQWQGYDRAPRSLASKILGGVWFAFVTVTLVTYTASLVNLLFWASTVRGKDPTQPPIRDLAALIQSSDYDYGAIRGGTTYPYLTRVAKGAKFDVMRQYMKSDRGKRMTPPTIYEGLAMVRRMKYAFITSSLLAKYLVNNPPDGVCDLMTVGETFGQRSYGFALPKNSPHIELLHHAILDAKESGVLEYLEQKWWVEKGQCWNATRAEKVISEAAALNVNKPKRVDLSMFWGALLMMGLGIIFSILAFVGEMIVFKFRGKYSEGNRPRLHELTEEPEVNTL